MLYLSAMAVVMFLLFSALPGSKSNLKKLLLFWACHVQGGHGLKKYSEWHRSSPSPVKFNTHTPVEYSNSSIKLLDLNGIRSTRDAVQNKERILILTPLRDTSPYLSTYFELLMAMTYPHNLIDLGFLVSDTTDETLAILSSKLENIQSGPSPFHSVEIFQKDFGMTLNTLEVERRHLFEAQALQKKAMGRPRNYLLYSALKPDHSWVLWRDVDIVESPPSILEDFIKHDMDVLVPNIWFHRYRDNKDIEGRFDFNSWVESDQGLALGNSLDKDTVIVEGHKEFHTGRKYMAIMGDWRYNE